jgi:subtilisin family serine protease
MTNRTGLSILLGMLIVGPAMTAPGIAERPSAAAVQAKGKDRTAAHAADRVIVKFKKGAEKSLGLKKIKHLRLIDASVFKVPAGDTAAALTKRLSSDPNVEYAELDYIQSAVVIPNDTRFGELWGLHNTGQTGGTPDADIDAPEAWNLATGSSEVVVGVIDTGVDYNHADLNDNIWTNTGETAGDGVDNDGNGYVDDIHGINAITGSGDPMDDNATVYHGTHCAGTVGAEGDNSLGVAGVCWTVKIIALKFLGASGSGATSNAVECIQYAIDMGADVLSNSWGGGGYSQALHDAIEAAKNAGILFIAAAGNDGNNNDITAQYPSSYDNENIIAVAATDHNDQRAIYTSGSSNYGPTTVDVAAPGKSILSSMAGNGYQYLGGTSMATPHVAGLAALLKSYNPSLTWSGIKSRILAGVDPLSSLSGLILTGGRINAYSSLTGTNPPHILSIEPDLSIVGEEVKIIGTGFGDSQGAGYVEFNGGVQAAIISWSDTQIDVTVPEGAQTGLVYVHDTNGIASNGVSFQVDIPYYSETQVANAYLGAGNPLHLQGDEVMYKYALPFSFRFFGTTYPAGTFLYIFENGYVDFASNAKDYSNSRDELRSNVRIAPLWIDLVTNGSAQTGEDVYVLADSDSLTIRWCAETFEFAEPMNFEAVLFKDGRIQFNYGAGNDDFHSIHTAGPTIGISCGACAHYYDRSVYDGLTQLNLVDSDLFAPPPGPTIAITSPDAASVWFKGTAQNITWTKSGDQNANVRIQLWRNTSKAADIATKTSNDGSHTWTPPATLAAASNYFVRITTLDNLVTDDSDLYTITGPSITVTSPNAASVWQRGTTQAITWTKLGSQAALVNIKLYRNNVFQRNIGLKKPNNGVFDWAIPADLMPQSGYAVRVKTTDGKVSDSSEPFKIIAPSIKISAPAAGAVWGRNTNQTITWTVNGTMNPSVKIHLYLGTTLVQTIVSSTPNSGSFPWTIPGSLVKGTNYKVRVRTLDNAITAKSGAFTIK